MTEHSVVVTGPFSVGRDGVQYEGFRGGGRENAQS